MRKPLLSLAVVALVAGACTSSSVSSDPYRNETSPPEHHRSEAPEVPEATPYDGVTYEDPGVNPYVDPTEDDASTFGLDVDTASYAVAQRYIADGFRPEPSSVRVEEWVNAFAQGYLAPRDDTFAIAVDGGPTPFTDPDEVVVRIGLQAREVRDRARDAASLTFIIDTSGSMERDGRLELVKDALRILVNELDAEDTVSVVTFGDLAQVVLRPTSAGEPDEILDAIELLEPGGSTNLEAGLRLGYEQARAALTENGIDRVVLASDGVANVGLTDPDEILRTIRDDASAGIELVSVGVGMGNFNDALLEQLADEGDGFYAYVNDLEEARTLFRVDLTSALQTVALDARVQVTFDRDQVDAYRLVGYENRDIADGAFSDPGVDAGAIGAGHAVTALYAVRLRADVRDVGRLATVDLRWTDPDDGRQGRLSRDISGRDLATDFGRSDPYFRFDTIVAASAEVLRDSRFGRSFELGDVLRVAEREADGLPATEEVHAFLDLLDQVVRIDD